MMQPEDRLLAAIDRLATDGSTQEICLLAALLACRGGVEMRTTGWQNPFREYADLAREGFAQALRGLIDRGIVVQYRDGTIGLNSDIMRWNRGLISSRCANRLFVGAHARFAHVLREIPYEVLRRLCRLQSAAAINRAHREMGDRPYWALKRAGLLVWNGRAAPRLFPSLHWVTEVPRITAEALTLDQGNALTWANMVNSGITFHMALATGHIVYDSETKDLTLPAHGQELALGYRDTAIRRRLRWLSDIRTETMHALIDELAVPLPAVWVKGRASQVNRAWILQPDAPLRVLFKDPTLRQYLRRLVRTLAKMGLAQLIVRRDKSEWYHFAPGIPPVAKQRLELPAERFSLPEELQAKAMAGYHLLRIAQDQGGTWRLRPALDNPDMPPGAAERMTAALGRLKFQHRVAGPADDGSYRIADPEAYRWAVLELLINPVAEFLTAQPEEEEVG
ncbi:MAG: hypothetical protein ACOY94_16220 [Bacillota bacterium]